MTEKRFILKYLPYETDNGEIIEADPYYIDKEEEYVDEEDYFTIDGYPTMSDKQVVDLLNELSEENEQLKQTIKGVYEILSIDVDVFSDKAIEHDINAYIELKELDNKDAYYIAKGTKKAIELLKKVMIE